MSKSTFSSIGVRHVIPLVLVLGLVFGWATVAFAQTSTGGQYGDPTSTPSGNPGSSGNAASTSGGAAAKGGDPGTAKGGSGGGSSGGSSGGSGGGPGGIATLPATGGEPLILVIVGGGALALGSGGLLALRRK